MIAPTGEVFWLTDRYPALTEERRVELTASIARDGLLTPITLTPQGVLLDGRHRLAACRAADVMPRFDVYAGDPVRFVLGVNSRRDLTDGARAFIALDVMEYYAELARQRQPRADDGTFGTVVAPGPQRSKARDQAAEAIGSISGRSVSRAKVVRELAPDLQEPVRAGILPLAKAERQARARRSVPPVGDPTPAPPAPNAEARTTPVFLLNGATLDAVRTGGRGGGP